MRPFLWWQPFWNTLFRTRDMALWSYWFLIVSKSTSFWWPTCSHYTYSFKTQPFWSNWLHLPIIKSWKTFLGIFPCNPMLTKTIFFLNFQQNLSFHFQRFFPVDLVICIPFISPNQMVNEVFTYCLSPNMLPIATLSHIYATWSGKIMLFYSCIEFVCYDKVAKSILCKLALH